MRLEKAATLFFTEPRQDGSELYSAYIFGVGSTIEKMIYELFELMDESEQRRVAFALLPMKDKQTLFNAWKEKGTDALNTKHTPPHNL